MLSWSDFAAVATLCFTGIVGASLAFAKSLDGKRQHQDYLASRERVATTPATPNTATLRERVMKLAQEVDQAPHHSQKRRVLEHDLAYAEVEYRNDLEKSATKRWEVK